MIAIETHQPADASPRATSSAQRSATPGSSSSPPTSRGAPGPQQARSPAGASTRPSGSRRSRSVSSAAAAAAADSSRAVASELRAGRRRRLRLGLGHRSSLARRWARRYHGVVQRLHRYGGRTMGARGRPLAPVRRGVRGPDARPRRRALDAAHPARGVLRRPALRAARPQPQRSRGRRCPPACGRSSTRACSSASPTPATPIATSTGSRDAGRDLFPAIVALMRWGDTHLAGPEGPPIVLRHDHCGELAHPRLTCEHCGGEVDARSVTPERGPGFRAPAASPAAPAPGRR